MNKISNFFATKLLYTLVFLTGVILNAQPATPPGGGVGGTTPGVPASPIDDYLFLLIPIAVMFIIYFAKKYKKQLN